MSLEFECLGELIYRAIKAFQDTRSLGSVFARCQESFCTLPAVELVLPLKVGSHLGVAGRAAEDPLPDDFPVSLPTLTSDSLNPYRWWAKQGSNL